MAHLGVCGWCCFRHAASQCQQRHAAIGRDHYIGAATCERRATKPREDDQFKQFA